MAIAFGEFVNFIAAGTTPADVIDFRPSDAAKARVADLIQREKTSGISEEEKEELDQFMQIEEIMRLAKAKARLQLRIRQ